MLTEVNEKTKIYKGHAAAVSCCQSDSIKLVSGSADHTIKIWEKETQICLYTLDMHAGLVVFMNFNIDI